MLEEADFIKIIIIIIMCFASNSLRAGWTTQ